MRAVSFVVLVRSETDQRTGGHMRYMMLVAATAGADLVRQGRYLTRRLAETTDQA